MIDDPVLVDDWHPVASVEQLADGGPVAARLLGEDIVLWRSGDELLAWRDLCVHRGTRLSLGRIVDGSRLECAYHGWTYGSDGRCVHIPAHPEQAPPAKAQAATYRAALAYGVVWVTLGSGATAIPTLRAAEDPAHSVLLAGPYRVARERPAHRSRTSSTSATFPFVHEGVLGDRLRPEIADYNAGDRRRRCAGDRRPGVSTRPIRHRARLDRDLHIPRAPAAVRLPGQARRAARSGSCCP